MTDANMTTSLDDLVGLLLQGKAPFGDPEFAEAARTYRSTNRGGAAVRKQVNLAACLYLQAKGERIVEPRVRELGGWGSRNDVLADMGEFTKGQRPATTVSMGKAMLSLGAPSVDILHLAMSQGLEAAHKALEAEMQAKFDKRIEEIQVLAEQRVLAAERNVLAATELKEAAQAQATLLEQKFDQAIMERVDLNREIATAQAKVSELTTQVGALTAALEDANARATRAEEEARALQQRLNEASAKREAEHKEHMLALDRARHGNDQLLATQQAEISRLGAMLEKSQAANEESSKAARRAESEVASTQAELAAAVAKIGDLQAQLDAAAGKLNDALKRAVATENFVKSMDATKDALIGLSQTVATTAALQAMEQQIANLTDSVNGLEIQVRKGGK